MAGQHPGAGRLRSTPLIRPECRSASGSDELVGRHGDHSDLTVASPVRPRTSRSPARCNLLRGHLPGRRRATCPPGSDDDETDEEQPAADLRQFFGDAPQLTVCSARQSPGLPWRSASMSRSTCWRASPSAWSSPPWRCDIWRGDDRVAGQTGMVVRHACNP